MGAITGLISSAVRAAERFDEESVRPAAVALVAFKMSNSGTRSIVLAARLRPRSAITTKPKNHLAHGPEKPALGLDPGVASGFRTRIMRHEKGRRSAERRMPSNVRTVPPGGEGVWKRSIADKLARSAQLICLRGPLAFRRSAAALAPASERQDSAQAALHAKHDAKALPPLRIALKQGTLRAGRNAGGA